MSDDQEDDPTEPTMRDAMPGPAEDEEALQALDVYIPTAEEVWDRIGRVLRTRFSTLRPELIEDLRAAFYIRWCETWCERLVRDRVRHWKTWLRHLICWRTTDYLRSPRHRADGLLGKSGGDDDDREDQSGTPRHTTRRGAVPLEDDPLEESEWRRAHARAWERLPERHRIVLLVYVQAHSGSIPDREEAARVATERLGLRSPLTENAYSIRVTRAAQHLIAKLSKIDWSWDHEFERLLVAEQGKRVVWACTNKKVDKRWWLDGREQAVFSVHVEISLGWRPRSDGPPEAARRLGRSLDQYAFDAVLRDALTKLEGVGEGPFLNRRLMMEYVAANWDRVQRPTGGG